MKILKKKNAEKGSPCPIHCGVRIANAGHVLRIFSLINNIIKIANKRNIPDIFPTLFNVRKTY